jgi:DNA-binding IscR family transcriptional regulator
MKKERRVSRSLANVATIFADLNQSQFIKSKPGCGGLRAGLANERING